jgi:hypothetical protein
MSKLEEEIRKTVDAESGGLFDQEKELIVRAATQVVKKYIEKGMKASALYALEHEQYHSKFTAEWLKENGII